VQLIQVENTPGMVRDKNSGAILNINSNEISEARALKREKRQEMQRRDNLTNDVEILKDQVGKILNLLENIGKNNG